jgi:hypothetical protein
MKGVSEFVLVLIILIIVIASILVVWLFYNSMFGSVTMQGETSSLGEALSSCMKIDSVSGNKTYLKNCGSGSIRNDTLSVFVDDASFNYSMKPASVGNGEIGTVELNIQNLALGNHKIRITTKSAEVERYVNVTMSGSNKVLKLIETS